MRTGFSGLLWVACLALCLTLCAALSACNQENENLLNWSKPSTDTISCDDYFAAQTQIGVLYNNVWNKNAAQTFAWSQCLEKSPANGDYGWSWVWPTKSNVIYAYPQIKIGSSPWAPAVDLTSEFPLKTSEVSSLVIAHTLEIEGSSEHNVATSMWLTNSANIGAQPNPGIIVAELMIWSYSTKHHMNPAGSHTGDIQVDGETWEVWVDKNWGDVSGANTNKWIYLTFRATHQSLQAKYDAIKFIHYAIEHELLPHNVYIADVELGTEIMSGSGLAWVKSFSVSVEK
jgi:hypothetical protein